MKVQVSASFGQGSFACARPPWRATTYLGGRSGAPIAIRSHWSFEASASKALNRRCTTMILRSAAERTSTSKKTGPVAGNSSGTDTRTLTDEPSPKIELAGVLSDPMEAIEVMEGDLRLKPIVVLGECEGVSRTLSVSESRPPLCPSSKSPTSCRRIFGESMRNEEGFLAGDADSSRLMTVL